MRVNIALFACGAVLVLAGIALWSVPAALILAGLPCIGVGLLRTEAAVRPVARRPAGAGGPRRHRRPGPARGALRLAATAGRRAS